MKKISIKTVLFFIASMIMVNAIYAMDNNMLYDTQEFLRINGVEATHAHLLKLEQTVEKKSEDRRIVKILLKVFENKKNLQDEIDKQYPIFKSSLFTVKLDVNEREIFMEGFLDLFNSFLVTVKNQVEEFSTTIILYDERTLEKKEVRLSDIQKGIEDFLIAGNLKKFLKENKERFTRFCFISYMKIAVNKSNGAPPWGDIFCEGLHYQPKMKLDYTRFALKFVDKLLSEYCKKYFFVIESDEVLSNDQIAKNNYISYLIKDSDKLKSIIQDRNKIAKKFAEIFSPDHIGREQYGDIERVLLLAANFLQKYPVALSKKKLLAKIAKKIPKDAKDKANWEEARKFGVEKAAEVKPESSEDQGRLNARSRSADSDQIKRSGSEPSVTEKDADNSSIKSTSPESSPGRSRVAIYRQDPLKRRSLSIKFRGTPKNAQEAALMSPTPKEAKSPELSKGSSTETELIKSSRTENKKRSVSDASMRKKSQVLPASKDKIKSAPESKSGSTDSELKKSGGAENLRKTKTLEIETTNVEVEPKQKKAPTRFMRSNSSTSHRQKIKPISQENTPEGVKSEEGSPKKNPTKSRGAKSCEDNETPTTPPVHVPKRIKNNHIRMESGEGENIFKP